MRAVEIKAGSFVGVRLDDGRIGYSVECCNQN